MFGALWIDFANMLHPHRPCTADMPALYQRGHRHSSHRLSRDAGTVRTAGVSHTLRAAERDLLPAHQANTQEAASRPARPTAGEGSTSIASALKIKCSIIVAHTQTHY